MSDQRIHLVTYATSRFRHRQILLGASGLVNGVVDTVTSWTPKKLINAGFEQHCKGIKLSERGSGFWAWKPFIIQHKLAEVPDGDLVFYCDVGRLYPFKLLDQPVDHLVRWMNGHNQAIMPGVAIPWEGPNSMWTKREALAAAGMDCPAVYAASPVQASFSLWLASEDSRDFVACWMDVCSQRCLVSDDPSRHELKELPDFRGHRHDQALLSLCCIAKGVKGLELGAERPNIDIRHPSQVSRLCFGEVCSQPKLRGRLLRAAVWPIEQIEQKLRRNVKFGKPINE
jgi:hypothetical protein